MSLRCPFREFHFRDQSRLDPSLFTQSTFRPPPPLRGATGKRWFFLLKFRELCLKRRRLLRIETCADASRRHELARFVHAEVQTADLSRRAGAIRIARDHELLPLFAFQFEPVIR